MILISYYTLAGIYTARTTIIFYETPMLLGKDNVHSA